VPWYVRIGFHPERWFSPSWLPAGEVPADAAKDFNSKDNELSVYTVLTEEDGLRAAIAIAAKRHQERAFGYALFDVAETEALGVMTALSTGESADPEVNTWHRDLKNLTFAKLSQIAKVVKAGAKIEDLPVAVFKARIKAGVESGQLVKALIDPRNLQ
jgi:hypothetical protein